MSVQQGNIKKKEEHTNKNLPIYRRIFIVLALVMLICIIIQTLFAGMAIFQSSEYWRHHNIFVKMFTYIPIFMIILSFVGRMSSALQYGSIGLFLLIFAQYFTANMKLFSGFHPVIALVMFGLSVSLLRNGVREKVEK